MPPSCGQPASQAEFHALLQKMNKLGVIACAEGQELIAPKDTNMLHFLKCFVWPIVESFWITLQYALTMLQNGKLTVASSIEFKIQCFANDLLNEKLADHLEASSQETVSNVLATLKSVKYVEYKMKEDVKSAINGSSLTVLATEKQLQVLAEKLSHYIKRNQLSNERSLQQIATQSIFGELKPVQASRL